MTVRDKLRWLVVSPDLSLPRDAVTQTFALLAVRRAGKSNAAAVMAEAMYVLGLPFTVIDPKGDWWGLRSSADGKGAGLPIPIFGGLHGDMPLTPGSGALMARLIIEHNLTCILDVSGFTKAARARFLADFAEKLYALHRIDPHPRHLFIEEADRVVPQSVMRADAVDVSRCVGAFSDIVRLGGSFGLGATLISQRSALISKDVLTQVETMIAMRTTSPQDRKAIKDWMEHHSISAEIVESLPSLVSGEAWVSSSFFLPEYGLPPISRIRFNQRTTYDSGATPKVGQPRRVATLADIDLGAVQAQMAEVTQEAEKNDPTALRREIIRLRRELQKRTGEPDPRIQLLTDEVSNLQAQIRELEAAPPQIIEVPVVSAADGVIFADLAEQLSVVSAFMRKGLDQVSSSAVPRSPLPPPPEILLPPLPQPPRVEPVRLATVSTSEDGGSEVKLGKAHRAILAVLAREPEVGLDRQEAGILTVYSPGAGHFGNAISDLRKAGMVEPGFPLKITATGIAELGEMYIEPPTGYALIDAWLGKVSGGESRILRALLEAWPGSLSRNDIGVMAGYAPGAGHFGNLLSHLKSIGLITGTAAAFTADETLGRSSMERAAR